MFASRTFFFLVPERILSPVDINDTFSNWAWHIPCSRMCHSVTHTWDGVQPPHTAPSYLPFSLNDLMSGTTVRVVFYMLHLSFTLQTGWLCTQPIASPPITTEIAATPRLVRPLISDQNSGAGAMAYPLSAIAGMLINVDIYVDRHYILWSRRSHTTLLEISASVPE